MVELNHGAQAREAGGIGPTGDWKRWLWYWGPALIWAIGLYLASAQPALPRPGERFGVSDDVVNYTTHALSYAVLAWLVWRPLWEGVGRLPDVVVALPRWAAWLFAVAYALADEIHQAFVPGRTASLWDVLADALGATAAMGLVWVMSRREGEPCAGCR